MRGRKLDCSLTKVRGWGLNQGTMVFDTLLEMRKPEKNLIDMAYYQGIGLRVLAHNTLFDVDAITGQVTRRWAPGDSHAVLSALPNRIVEGEGGGILAVGCYTSNNGVCGKTILVRKDGENAPSVTYASSLFASSPDRVKPAALDDTTDNMYLYAIDTKGTSMSILQVTDRKSSHYKSSCENRWRR